MDEAASEQNEPANHPGIAKDAPAVALLLIHGMGIEKEGDTLVDMGDPFLDWASKWLSGRHGKAHVFPSKTNQTSSCPTCDTNTGPMHVHCEWTLPGSGHDGGTGKTVHVIVAESWWADCFKPPSASVISEWLPSLIWGVTWKGLVWITLFLAAVAMGIITLNKADLPSAVPAAIIMAALTGILLFLFAPALLALRVVPPVKSSTGALLDFLTLWVGDVLVYERNPIAAANARGKVAEDLSWLIKQSDRQIIAAHSLGSLLAVDVLAQSGSRSVQTLVTFGSAIKLLERRIGRYIRTLDKMCPQLAWVNVYDPADFIAGPIDYAANFPRNLRVDNCQSILKAHSSYPGNAEQFLTVLFRVVTSTAGYQPDDVEDRLKEALLQRHRRSVIRCALIALTAPALMGVTLLLLKAGWPQWLADAVTKIPVPQLVRDIVAAAQPTLDGTQITGTVILCLTTAGALMIALMWVMRLFFAWWEMRAEDELSLKAAKPRPGWLWLFFALMAGAIVIPFFLEPAPTTKLKQFEVLPELGFEGYPLAAAALIFFWILLIRYKRQIRAKPEKQSLHPDVQLGAAFAKLRPFKIRDWRKHAWPWG